MKQLLSLIILLFVVSNFSFGQTAVYEPFADAIPFRINSPTTFFLTNQDAEAVKAFFEQPEFIQPEKIECLSNGYYSGYRLCYNRAACENQKVRSEWIQVYTINTDECIRWYEDNNPDFLMVPFQNIRSITDKRNNKKESFTDIFNQYKHLACQLYRQSKDSDGQDESELSLVLQKYYSKINYQTGQMLVSGDKDVFSQPLSNADYNWNLWMQCLEEIDVVGYTTLIEYSDIPTSKLTR